MFALFKMGGARPSNGAKANHFILEVYTVIGELRRQKTTRQGEFRRDGSIPRTLKMRYVLGEGQDKSTIYSDSYAEQHSPNDTQFNLYSLLRK